MEDGQLLEPYRRMLERKQFEMNSAWITKPLGLCGHCFCGQVGFWTAVFLFGISFKVILFTAFTLFFNELKNILWNRV